MRKKTLCRTFVLLLLIFATIGGIGVRTSSGSTLPLISIEPPTNTAPSGGNFTIAINVTGITASDSLYMWEAQINFNPSILETSRTHVRRGPFLRDAVSLNTYTTIYSEKVDNDLGVVNIGEAVAAKMPPDPQYPPVGAVGNGTLATITFLVKAEGATLLHLEEGRHLLYTIKGATPVEIVHEVNDGIFDNRAGPPSPPVADFYANMPVANVSQTISFNASASYDPDAWLVSYEWNFGDNTTEIYEGENLTAFATHAYDQGGNYTVKLTVTDYDNLIDTATKNVTVRLVGTIAGRVTEVDLTGFGISYATVEADGHSTVTDLLGYYSLEIEPGTYNITASAAGYINETKIDIVVYPALTTIVNFTLTPLGYIAGRVTEVDLTGFGISYATVEADGHSTVTDLLGYYSLEIEPGTYNITASAAGYINETKIDIVVYPALTTIVNFTLTPIPQTGTLSISTTPVIGEVFVNGTSWGLAPQSRVVDVGTYNVSFGDVAGNYTPTWQLATVHENLETIVEGVYEPILGTINGTITDVSTDLPITGATITADSYSATTDAEGHYSIEVSPGTYSVAVSSTKYVSQSKTATVTSNTTTTLDFALTPANGTISGTVTDSSTGDPIAGATATANGVSVSTGTDGTYSIELPPGTYAVTASADGYEDSSKTDITVVAEETTPVDFELTPVQPQNILLYAGVAAIAIIIVAAIAVYFLKVRKPT